jgi:glycosyltransferase involved in cell wall biosynthesis
LSEKRGIIEIIKATEYFKNNTELWIAGQWSDNKFQKTCENLNEYKNIKYLGRLNHEAISQLLSNSNLGICLLHPTLSYINSYPIKVFEYLQHGLPVLMSNFKMWEQLFYDNCEYVDPLNVKMIAEKINSMLDDNIKLQQMSIKGINLIHQNYNWEIESLALNKLYMDL